MPGRITKLLITISILFLTYFARQGIADPIGEVDTVGYTWQNIQGDGANNDDKLVLDTTTGTVYFIWTLSPNPPWQYYNIPYFNSYNPRTGWAYSDTGLWMFPSQGNRINPTIMMNGPGGLRGLELGLTCEHQPCTMRGWYEADSFAQAVLDTIPYPVEISPLRACSRLGLVHMVAVVEYGWPDFYYLGYNHYKINPFELGEWQTVDTINGPLYSIATSTVSEKTAFCYIRSKVYLGHPSGRAQEDNDLYLFSSPDGLTWDWSNRRNLTSFGPRDPFRMGFASDILIDHNDITHIIFQTIEARIDSVNPDSNHTWRYMSYLWHWSEQTDSFTVVADGWIQDPHIGSCYFYTGLPVDHPQMAEDPQSGHLYVVYERRIFEDCAALQEFPNSDIWASVSTDGGLNWSQGANITDTPTPGCYPGDCMCEIRPTMNDLVNDTLHIDYQLCKDSDVRQFDYDVFWTESKIIYQKIPADSISTTPLIPQFSIRDGPVRCHYIPGDINGDGFRNGADVVYAVNYFKGGADPLVDCDCAGMGHPFFAAGDVNGSCSFSGMDVTFYVGYLKGNWDWPRHCRLCPPDYF
jgi:hypothetical protein